MQPRTVEDAKGRKFELRPLRCPTCDRSATRVIGVRGGARHRYGLGVETTIVQCERCALMFPDPFPYPLDADALYADPEKYFAGIDEEAKIEGYRHLIREIKTRWSGTPSLLDIGSGRGELLAAAKREGLRDVTGLDTMSAMVEHVKERYGIDVVTEPLEKFSASCGRSFDVITLAAVLEHVHDPDALIASVAKVTRPGALLYIDVPNEPHLLTYVGNAINRIRGSDAIYNLAPTFEPFHVFGFNRRALEVLLEKHGFRLIDLRIHAAPQVPARAAPLDKAKAFVATQINRVANLTGTAANLFAWARRVGS